jgi:hypothetical protein
LKRKDKAMDYPNQREVTFADNERLVELISELASRYDELKGRLNPAQDDWPLQHGEVGVLFVPSNPPSVACILEHPDTGHWMLQYPCGSIFIYDITAGQPTF